MIEPKTKKKDTTTLEFTWKSLSLRDCQVRLWDYHPPSYFTVYLSHLRPIRLRHHTNKSDGHDPDTRFRNHSRLPNVKTSDYKETSFIFLHLNRSEEQKKEDLTSQWKDSYDTVFYRGPGLPRETLIIFFTPEEDNSFRRVHPVFLWGDFPITYSLT